MEYLRYWPACMRSRWQDIDQVLLFVFGNTINNTVQNLHTLLVHSTKFFLTWIQEGTLKQASAHLPHLDSQLEQRIKIRMEQINVTIINPLRIIISYNIDPSPYTIHYHSTLLLTNSPLLSTGSRYVSWLSCSLKSVAFSLGLSILMSSWGFSYTGLLTRIKHLIKVLTNYEFIDKTY